MKKYTYKIYLETTGEVFAEDEEDAKEKAIENYLEDLALSNISLENELEVKFV